MIERRSAPRYAHDALDEPRGSSSRSRRRCCTRRRARRDPSPSRSRGRSRGRRATRAGARRRRTRGSAGPASPRSPTSGSPSPGAGAGRRRSCRGSSSRPCRTSITYDRASRSAPALLAEYGLRGRIGESSANAPSARPSRRSRRWRRAPSASAARGTPRARPACRARSRPRTRGSPRCCDRRRTRRPRARRGRPRRRAARRRPGSATSPSTNRNRGSALVVREVRPGARVRQLVEHHDVVVRATLEQQVHEVRADEPGSTGHEDALATCRPRAELAVGPGRLRRPAEDLGGGRRALASHVYARTRSRPARHQALAQRRRPRAVAARPAAISPGSCGSTSTAASPATSGSEDVVEVRTGHAGREPLEHREPEPLVQRRVREHLGAGEQRTLVVLGDVAGHHDPATDGLGQRRATATSSRPALAGDPVHASAGDHQLRVGVDASERLEQAVEVLPRLDPADEQRVRAR